MNRRRDQSFRLDREEERRSNHVAHEELAVITGPALDQWEREQAVWNARVEKMEVTDSLRAPSHFPLRGMIFIAYLTLMRPINNRALMWEEVTLDPVKRTGHFRLNRPQERGQGH